MAKKINLESNSRRVKPKVNNKGVHSKKKSSGLKTSKNYVKPYKGQGR